MNTKDIGIYDFPTMRRGDTFRARNIATLTQATVALPLTSALMQVRTRGGTLVQEWTTTGDSPNAEITGDDLNTLRLLAVDKAVTALWPPGEHEYDIEFTFASDSAALTLMGGKFPIAGDIARPTA